MSYGRPWSVGMQIHSPSPPIYLQAQVCIYVRPIHFASHASEYETGCHVVFPRTRSFSPQSLEPKLKHYSRMNFSLADMEASDVDPDAYAVLLDLEGNISENTSGNFFIVTDGVLRTPTDRAILQGVARLDVLELADRLGIPTSEEDLQPYDAYTADEAFLSNTIYGVLPVGRIDNRAMTDEVPGPVTQRLLAAWGRNGGYGHRRPGGASSRPGGPLMSPLPHGRGLGLGWPPSLRTTECQGFSTRSKM